MYLGIDPGAGFSDTIGIAKLTATGEYVEVGQKNFDDFIAWLEQQKDITHVVYESYIIRRSKVSSHVGSKVETIQTIGAIKSWCRRNKVPMTEQKSDILPGAQKLFQIKMPTDHSVSHQISALLHLMYFMYQKGLIKSALEQKLEAERGK